MHVPIDYNTSTKLELIYDKQSIRPGRYIGDSDHRFARQMPKRLMLPSRIAALLGTVKVSILPTNPWAN